MEVDQPAGDTATEGGGPGAAPRVAPELAAALARAQGEFGQILKERSAVVRMKSGGEYRYSFADLASVLEAIRAPLAKHELAILQLPAVRIDAGATFVQIETILVHCSGASISSRLELPASDPSPQSIGSAMTYARRYSVLALLGLAAEDDDAAAAQPRRPPPPPPARASKPPARKAQAPDSKPSKGPETASENQRKLIWAKARERAREFVEEGDTEALKQLAEEIVRAAMPPGVESSKELGSRQVDGVLKRIEAFELPASPETAAR